MPAAKTAHTNDRTMVMLPPRGATISETVPASPGPDTPPRRTAGVSCRGRQATVAPGGASARPARLVGDAAVPEELGPVDPQLAVDELVDRAEPSEGRQWGGGWRALTIGPERVAYLRVQNGQPVLTAADYGPWRIDYSAHSAGFPRIVRVRRSGDTAIDITARVEQLQVNTAINPLAWVVEIPSDADPMTLDELRSIAPLAEKK